MTPTITGLLYDTTVTKQITDNFRTRTFILKVIEQGQNGQVYEQYIECQLINNNCEVIDKFQKGQSITVTYNLRGRLWTSPDGEEKCITNINAWKIEANEAFTAKPTAQHAQTAQVNAEVVEEEEDLPF